MKCPICEQDMMYYSRHDVGHDVWVCEVDDAKFELGIGNTLSRILGSVRGEPL